MKTKTTRAERAARAHAERYQPYGSEGSFLAGAAWQKREDLRAVRKENSLSYGAAALAVNAIKQRSKERVK